MIKSIANGLGAIATGVAKIASAINKSKAFKALKLIASATIGIPVALVVTAVTSVAWAGIKVAGLLDAKIIKGVFGSSIWEDTAWASSLASIENFMRSTWEDFGVYAHLKVVKFIGDQWAERQSEAGYGDAVDDPENPENHIASNPDNIVREERVVINVNKIDHTTLSAQTLNLGKFNPTKINPKQNTLEPNITFSPKSVSKVKMPPLLTPIPNLLFKSTVKGIKSTAKVINNAILHQ